MNEKKRLKKEQAAKRLGIAVSTLNHWIVAGTAPPYYKFRNRFVYFLEEDIDKFLRVSSVRKVGA